MSERINLDLESLEGDGHGLYVANIAGGIHVFEERPSTDVHIDGDHLTTTNSERADVYVTSITDDGDIEIFDAETMEVVERISGSDIYGKFIPTSVLDEMGFVRLELVN